ncbi:hypothetical protein [Burkholderia ubonensis]|uniref:hypothetical protein n=1 Tax=Burkholderia ubonensis TaxID=101571 RepID=UPI0012FE5094|nr:hypothetical protein [Burkholderia ubonensis]
MNCIDSSLVMSRGRREAPRCRPVFRIIIGSQNRPVASISAARTADCVELIQAHSRFGGTLRAPGIATGAACNHAPIRPIADPDFDLFRRLF